MWFVLYAARLQDFSNRVHDGGELFLPPVYFSITAFICVISREVYAVMSSKHAGSSFGFNKDRKVDRNINLLLRKRKLLVRLRSDSVSLCGNKQKPQPLLHQSHQFYFTLQIHV